MRELAFRRSRLREKLETVTGLRRALLSQAYRPSRRFRNLRDFRHWLQGENMRFADFLYTDHMPFLAASTDNLSPLRGPIYAFEDLNGALWVLFVARELKTGRILWVPARGREEIRIIEETLGFAKDEVLEPVLRMAADFELTTDDVDRALFARVRAVTLFEMLRRSPYTDIPAALYAFSDALFHLLLNQFDHVDFPF